MVTWVYPLRDTDDGDDWALAFQLPKAEARARYEQLLGDAEARLTRLDEFAARAGIDFTHDVRGFDALNELYLELIDSDFFDWRVFRAIVWDVSLLIGTLAIEQYPDTLRWDFPSTARKTVGFQSPVLVGYRGVSNPRYSDPIFVNLEGWMRLWMGQHSGLVGPEEPRMPKHKIIFSGVFRTSTNGAETPFRP